MPFKPSVVSQLSRQTGMGRPGGIMSQNSAPKVQQGSKGAGFAAMENALLKVSSPNPKNLAGTGNSGRQFFTQASGGDAVAGLPKSPKVSLRAKKFPTPKVKY